MPNSAVASDAGPFWPVTKHGPGHPFYPDKVPEHPVRADGQAGLPRQACCRRVGFTSDSGLAGRRPALPCRANCRLMRCSKASFLITSSTRPDDRRDVEGERLGGFRLRHIWYFVGGACRIGVVKQCSYFRSNWNSIGCVVELPHKTLTPGFEAYQRSNSFWLGADAAS
jgi:hypothetical protein